MKLKIGLILTLLSICLSSCLIACSQEPPLTECEINGHDFSIILENGAPVTCTTDGFHIAECSRCGETEQITTPATGHTETTVPGVEATCTKDGTTDSVVCSECNEVITPATTIPKGHTVGEVSYILTPPATSSYYKGYVEFLCGRGCKVGGYKQIYTTPEHPDGQFPLPNLDDSAYTVEVDGEDNNYSIEIEGKTVNFTVSNFEFGGITSIPNSTYVYKYNGTTANLVIPETYNGKTIIGVYSEAFKGNTSIQSVTLPSTVKEINASAFEGCTNLTTINMAAEGVTTISDNAFKGCSKLNTITLPSTLTTIGKNAFANCYLLENVSLPQSIRLIDECAFDNCNAISSLTVPANTTVKKFAFRNCKALEEVVLYSSTNSTAILMGCDNLKKLTLSNPHFNLLNLFNNTESFNSSHKLPSTLTELTLIGNDNVNDVNNYTYNEYDVLKYIKKVNIVNCTAINYGAFDGFTALTDVTLPNEMSKIYANVFSDCTLLNTTISNNGKYLGNQTNPYVALIGYVEPTTQCGFTVNANTKSIAVSSDFWSKFTSYTIPTSVSYIGSTSSCSPSANVTYQGTIGSWFKIDASYVNFFKNGTVTFSDGKTHKEITNLVLEEGTKQLYKDVISCFNLTSITLPTSLDYIQAFSFDDMDNLKTIYYNGEHQDWYNLINNSHSNLLKNITNVYFYNGNEYYEPTYIQYGTSIDNIKCFDKLEKIIISKNVNINNNGTTFDAFIGKCDLYYLGDVDYWALYGNKKTIIESKFNVYCYQETEQTLSEFMASPIKLWHYNQNGEPTAWVEVGNTVASKTYTYSTTTVNVSDAYWAMLQQAKAQGMLGQLFETQFEIDMVTSSATKADYEEKLANFSKLIGTDMTISFTSNVMTVKKDSTVQLNYIEIDGQIYAKVGSTYSVYATIDGNTIIEGVADEYVTVKHVWTCQ